VDPWAEILALKPKQRSLKLGNPLLSFEDLFNDRDGEVVFFLEFSNVVDLIDVALVIICQAFALESRLGEEALPHIIMDGVFGDTRYFC
jgi:hypothetical protein